MSSLSIAEAERLVSALHQIRHAETADLSAGFERRLARFLSSFRKARSATVGTPPVGAVAASSALDMPRAEALVQKLHRGLQNAAAAGDLIDVWSIAGLGRRETRNAAVLAWLLNPRGSHGQGVLVLRGLLSRIADEQPTWAFDDAELDRVVVRTEHHPLGDIHDRIDIALDGPSFILFLELKIGSTESRDQVARYVRAAEQKRAAFGKAHGHVAYLAPTRPTSPRDDVAYLTWSDLADTMVSSLRGAGLRTHSRLLVERFARHVARF